MVSILVSSDQLYYVLTEAARRVTKEVTRRNRASNTPTARKHVHQGSECKTFGHAKTHAQG